MATIKHRFQTAIADDPAADVGADEWNDSLVVAGGTDAGLFYRDAAAADGWSIATGILTDGLKLTKYNNVAPANGQLLIGNTAGGTWDAATITGTANQVTVTNGAGTITLSAPQDIHTGATPQFARLGLGGAAGASSLLTLTGGTVTASAPVIDATQTWNAGATAFQALDLNVTTTAFAAGSRLLRVRRNDFTMFSINPAGIVAFGAPGIEENGGLYVDTQEGNWPAVLLHNTNAFFKSHGWAFIPPNAGYPGVNIENSGSVALRISDGIGSGTAGTAIFSIGNLGQMAWVAQTVAASTPLLDLAQAWNNATAAFTALKLNITDTASAAASLLMDLQVGAASKFKVDKDGTGTFAADVVYRAAYPGVTRTSMSGDATLTSASDQYQMFDPNGADRAVTLPTAVTKMGYVIKHYGSANTITVKRADATTLVTLTAGDTASCIYDGTAWQVL